MMIALVTGGASSGKSTFAETLALALPEPHVYVATMQRGGEEAEARVAKHVRARDGKGFVTIELAEQLAGQRLRAGQRPRSPLSESPRSGRSRTTGYGGVVQPGGVVRPAGTVLVEDLSNLLLNGLEDALPELLACENAVVVTNEIGCDGVAYDDFTAEFIERLGALSCEVAARADLVVEVVAGVPNVVKGELPWAC